MNPNDSAFPHTTVQCSGHESPNHGLTKREYLAAMALQGILSNFSMFGTESTQEIINAAAPVAASTAKLYADDLIAELSKEHQ